MTTPRRPPGRYDERRPLPRSAVVAGAAVLAVALLALAWTGYARFGRKDVQVSTLGYQVLDDRSVEIRFEVRKAAAETAECALSARAADGTEVAATVVRVGPAAQGTVVTTSRLSTSRRAAVAEATGCRSLGQP